MEASSQLPADLKKALQHGLLARFPLTFLPFINQQIHQWEYLFPNERQSTEKLLMFVDSLSPEQSAAQFSEVVRIEDRMGIRRSSFTIEEQTIQDASELARSPYYQEWRQAVQAVFNAADSYAAETNPPMNAPRNRAILLHIPATLPIERDGAWNHWREVGRQVKLAPSENIASPNSTERHLVRLIGSAALTTREEPTQRSSDDVWVIDGAKGLVEAVMAQAPPNLSNTVLLSYDRLSALRENFSREMNSMSKNLTNADSLFDQLRRADIAPLCPAEVTSDPAIREFVRTLFLSGNGALIFGNSFVEWAASEAIRRARPRFLTVRFGIRSKPKPFTSVVVFENPDHVNPLPSVDDGPGSALDAQILSAYIWFSALRYEEYRHSTVCICVAESISEAYLVTPPEFSLAPASEPIQVSTLIESLHSWIAE